MKAIHQIRTVPDPGMVPGDSHGHLVKGLIAAMGLDPRYVTHACPHTDTIRLYLASGADLEIVYEQLAHASIKTTTIYAKVTKEDKARAADALAKAYPNSQ